MKKIILLFTLIGISSVIEAQIFQYEFIYTFPAHNEGAAFSSVAFADIDGDMDQDLLITGNQNVPLSNISISNLYTNDGTGNYTLATGTPFIGVFKSSIAFADIDGDNDQDVLITGSHPIINYTVSYVSTSRLYRNDGAGNYTFVSGAPFSGVSYGSIAFTDVDGDNDQDLLITGSSLSGAISELYTNDGLGNYSVVSGTPFTGVYFSSIAFADVDGDNDQDVLITGYNNSIIPISELYINDGTGNYMLDTGTIFSGAFRSSTAFADIDNDNDKDLLITGMDELGHVNSKLYRNDGLGNFTLILGTPFIGVWHSSIAFADIDGDNDQDVLIIGQDFSAYKHTTFYINDGAGNYTVYSAMPLLGYSDGSIAFTDIDGDNDSDFLITGSIGPSIANLYRNTTCVPNFGTDIQISCDSYTWIDGNTYTSSNNTATYVLTNIYGCDSTVTLNLSIDPANTSNTSVIQSDATISSEANGANFSWLDCNNGYSKILGEMYQTYTATTNGNYAVEVTQNGCVDTSACYSVTTVGIDDYTQPSNNLYPNPVNNELTIESQGDINQIEVYNITGQLLQTVNPKSSVVKINFSAYVQGVYLVKVYAADGDIGTSRVVKNY